MDLCDLKECHKYLVKAIQFVEFIFGILNFNFKINIKLWANVIFVCNVTFWDRFQNNVKWTKQSKFNLLTFQSPRTIHKHHRIEYRRLPWWLNMFCLYFLIIMLINFKQINYCPFRMLFVREMLSLLLSAINWMCNRTMQYEYLQVEFL